MDGSVIVAAIYGEFKLRRFKTYPVCGLELLHYPRKFERFKDEKGAVVFGVATYVLNDMRSGEFDENPVL
ncbi:hypothetical protein [Sodalis ligni]|uniref:hypothetical protein n=1 Tax=Sodalis ligni TaxID=2697027 RepID=UPI001052C1BB|nr:hypothetical protein [Sodalis ligni]